MYACCNSKLGWRCVIFEFLFVGFGYNLYFCNQNNNVLRMVKTEMTWTSGAIQCQISNTIITPVFVSGWFSEPALNFNEDEY